MTLNPDRLRAALTHGDVTRVVVAGIRGSTPREVGAAMLVWHDGQSGTIGGGTLEYEAAQAARAGQTGLIRKALGPDLGQCCGGAVSLLFERITAKEVALIETRPFFARPVDAAAGDMPLSVERILARARDRGDIPDAGLVDGWMIEPVTPDATPMWIWGAGHVGRALVDVLSPLPDLALTWVDTAANRFPDRIPYGVTAVPAARPEGLIAHAPCQAEHLILTYSHELDLSICHGLLGHDFAFAGLIGSSTKWARFRRRLAALGHASQHIARITCPIGDPALGKHPQAIAIGIAAARLARIGTARQKVRA